jgi:hypothetical protein
MTRGRGARARGERLLARAAVHGTEEKRQGEEMGLRQVEYVNKVRPMARGQGTRWSERSG